MRIRVICLILSAAAVVAALPIARTETVPLAGIKLVAERVAPPAELAAASRNGNRNGNRGGAATAGFAVAKSTWFARREDRHGAADLVLVAMR